MKEDILEKLLDISRKMAENRLLDPLLEYAIEVVLELFQAESGYLVLLKADNTLDFRVCRGRCDELGAEPREQISHTIFEDVIKKGKSLVLANASVDPNFQSADSVNTLRLRSVMCVPLIARGNTLGAIYIENRSKEALFTEDDLEPLEHFAIQAAVSIDNAILNNELENRVAIRTAELKRINELLRAEIEERKRIEQQLHILATTDPLTGALNRRRFFELAEQEIERCQRYERQISIILVDLDHFKEINDSYGHIAGDQLLQAVADRFNQSLRKIDTFGRYGGDEFVVLLPETTIEQAQLAAKRIHSIVTSSPVETSRGTVPLSLSIGVASLVNTDDMEKLLIKTDQALYKAKAEGRNRVVVFDEEEEPRSKSSRIS